MTPTRRCLNAGRALLARHTMTGAIPALELRVWLAEMEAVIEREEATPGPDPDRNAHGFPTELPPR